MALSTPTNVLASLLTGGSSTVTYEIDWEIRTGDHPGPYEVVVQYSRNSGSWTELVTESGMISSTTHSGALVNSTYRYRVHWSCEDCAGTSAWGYSNTIVTYGDTATETCTLTDEVTQSDSSAGSIVSDSITMAETITTILSSTATETVTMTDTVRDGTTLKTNYRYYLGAEGGAVYTYSDEYFAYGASPITSYLKIKKTDYSDLFQEASGRFNTTYRAVLTYIDKGEHFVTFYYSIDGGATWTGIGKTIGTAAATGKACTAFFDFIATAEFFNFKIESASTTGTFQWVGLEMYFAIGGPIWSI
jgi:hypothetical protein